MDTAGLQKYQDIAMQYVMEFGVKILAAVAFWVIGRILIGFVVNLVRGALEKQKVDPTALRYVGSIITVTLNVLLVCWRISPPALS
jgi:small conductance mechanosensitive channel